MIQDIFPHVFHNEFQKLTPRPEDLLLAYRDHAVLSAPAELRLPSCGDFPGVEDLRKLARKDLDKAMLLAYSNTIRYLLEGGLLIHPHCISGYNELILAAKAK